MPFRKPRATAEPTFTDIEQGRRHENDASQSSTGADSSENDTSESRGSSGDLDRPGSKLAAQWETLRGRLPAPIVRYTGKAVEWIRGPQPPKTYRIDPLFENIQTLPIRLLGRLPKIPRLAILFLAFVIWVVVFGVIISGRGLPADIGGFGRPVRLACTTRLWYVLQIIQG